MSLYIWVKLERVSNLSEERCLKENYKSAFEDLGRLKIGSVYNFSKVFECKDWDEIVFVSPYASRTRIFIKTRILLPKIDFSGMNEDTVLLFFVKNKNVISKPISMYHPDFIFVNDMPSNGCLILDRENTSFIYRNFENPHYDNLKTLELYKKVDISN